MSRRIAIRTIVLLVLLEGGVQAWRHVGIPLSTAPVFYWREVPLVTTAPPPFGQALVIYRADRGAEQTKELPDGRKMTIFYFEWDSIELGPLADLGGHEAEGCNVVHGSFKLLQSGGQRTYETANGETLRFDYTLLADPNGNPVHVYKMPWSQGYGEWVSSPSGKRATRLQRSFIRHRGAGRVLEAGLFGAACEDEAWQLFQRETLDKLVWSQQ